MTSTTNEEWRPVVGLEGYYSVSNMGRIRTEARAGATMKNGVKRAVKERILLCSPTGKGGYPRFNAGRDGASKVLFVHQCVMLAFKGAPQPGEEVRHLSGDPTDCRLENLAYGTRAANVSDAKRHGTFPAYERRPGAKITREAAEAIAASGLTADELSVAHGIKPATVRQIRRGETWAEFTKEVRQPRYYRSGEAASWSKLTVDQVIDIYRSTDTQRALASRYGISRRAIQMIKSGRNWKAVTGAQ